MAAEVKLPEKKAEAWIRKKTKLTGILRWQALHGDGSDRLFYRVADGRHTVVLCWCPSRDQTFPNENDSFVYMGNHLLAKGIPVPRILFYAQADRMILLEDLGSLHLQEAVAAGRRDMALYYEQAVELLVKMQVLAAHNLDTTYCFDTPSYDRHFIVERELKYFHNSCLCKVLGMKVPWEEVAPEYTLLASRAGDERLGRFFLHRDFQSRNLMINRGRVYVIDFQGGRLGPPQYDLAALLEDAYVEIPEDLKASLLRKYTEHFAEFTGTSQRKYLRGYPHVALCRILQMLAAFSFLSLVKGKTHFAASLPVAWQRFSEIASRRSCEEYVFLRSLTKTYHQGDIAAIAEGLTHRSRYRS
ncbi:MAG: phosphotransferase [Deltaproteobacteria bacterium]|nr:phosphotransferase [Deltaproteobacteria bacterium]MBW2070162.1 phosphotransferase [Deltaproteobacteria bacterium]